MNIQEYVADNIKEINNSISSFKKDSPYNDTEIKKYLKDKLFNDIYNDPILTQNFLRDFKELGYKKSKIKDLANKYILYRPDLENFIRQVIFDELNQKITYRESDILNKVKNSIFDLVDMESGKLNFIENDLKHMLSKALFVVSINGFYTNIINVESGVMTANAGDSAQFLFLSRAILAGYNTSNVDVRSSRYDAIIDYHGKLLKVQVKGITSGNIGFKDRDRGGQGIDHHHERNKGKRITGKDCDIFVAVDKQIGICYIIPMKEIDMWDDDEIKSVKVSKLQKYKEAWHIIDEIAEQS